MPSLKKNLFYNVMYRVLILIVPFVTSPYVSRVLGPEGVGTYAVTTAIAKYFTIFALLGMENYGNRTIAKAKGDKKELSVAFWNLFYFQLMMSSMVLAVYIAYTMTIGYSLYGLVGFCQIPYILSTVFEISWFFYGMEEFKSIVLRNASVKILAAASVFLFVKNRNDVWIYVFINALSLLIGQLCLWPFLKKYVSFEKPQWQLIISHFKPNCVLMVSVLAVSIYTLMDKIMIEWLSGTADVGYYENTEKVLTIANNAAGAIGAVMLPRISSLRARGENGQVLQYINKSMKYIMIIAIALSFGMASISKSFAFIYFGQAFAACGAMIFVIAPAVMCYAWSNIIRTQYLLPKDMDNVFVIATVFAAIFNFVLNRLFIPRFGALGAVIGTLGAQFTELFYQTVKVKRSLPIKKYICGLIPYILIGFGMLLICKWIEHCLGISLTTLLLQIGIGACTYLCASFMYLYVSKDELITSILKKMHRNKTN